MNVYVIEHLEGSLEEWCFLEYQHISKLVGRESLWFCNVLEKDVEKLKEFGKVYTSSVRDLGLPVDKVCVLDPEAKEVLAPSDSSKFDYFVFGGILGDHPPRKRTKKELTSFLPNVAIRNLGRAQLPTDNAVYLSKAILDGKEFSEFKFQKGYKIKINEILETKLPFSYVLVDGKPLVNPRLVELIKRKDS